MKKNLLTLILIVGTSMLMTSCYTYTHVVGDGAKSGVTVKEKNHYFIYGLAAGKQSNPKEMAGNAKNYEVTITHSFVDGLLNALTFGIYTPTSTIVQK